MDHVYMIIDSTTNTMWAIFEDSKKESIVKYFDTLKNNRDFIVLTYKGNKEVKRESFLSFKGTLTGAAKSSTALSNTLQKI